MKSLYDLTDLYKDAVIKTIPMNNSVTDAYGKVVGFRCWRCGGVFQSMWGETCNGCRHQDEENEKLRTEIRKLTEALNKK